tara:strand:+ start:4131 stop:5564 length:1434 start_codon:yes stop_codon:yes gene_type:complete
MNDFIIVGGGNSGYISALMLKRSFPRKRITIIRSSKIGIIGVGESSTEHFGDFCQFCDIDTCDFILKTKSTFKVGVYFDNWSDEDFLHNVNTNNVATSLGNFFPYLHKTVANNRPTCEMNYFGAWDNKVPLMFFNSMNHTPTKQFHFDTQALNKYLEDLCLKVGIEVIEDEIKFANVDPENGNIKSVTGRYEYYSKFFIDCSGFSRLLLEKTLGVKWKSYSEYLPLNSAISFTTDEMEEYNMYTKSTARDYGWSWQIPTQDRTGNGYVFCDRFIDEDQAHKEMEEVYGQEIFVNKTFKFDPGRLEKSWYKNCYAVGLSQNFVEPLEATSMGSVIQQMFAFIHTYPSNSIDECNELVSGIFENMFDYVQAHYLVKKENTAFWKEVKNDLKITPSLQGLLDLWKVRFPQLTDVSYKWSMFNTMNYILILYGLKWFDRKKVFEEYKHIEHIQLFQWEETKDDCLHIGHKQFIKEVVKSNI